MSDVLHRRHVDVTITAQESAKELAETDAGMQAQFFLSFAEAARGYSWSVQCRYIADELQSFPDGRSEIAGMLETLADHLREARQ